MFTLSSNMGKPRCTDVRWGILGRVPTPPALPPSHWATHRPTFGKASVHSWRQNRKATLLDFRVVIYHYLHAARLRTGMRTAGITITELAESHQVNRANLTGVLNGSNRWQAWHGMLGAAIGPHAVPDPQKLSDLVRAVVRPPVNAAQPWPPQRAPHLPQLDALAFGTGDRVRSVRQPDGMIIYLYTEPPYSAHEEALNDEIVATFVPRLAAFLQRRRRTNEILLAEGADLSGEATLDWEEFLLLRHHLVAGKPQEQQMVASVEAEHIHIMGALDRAWLYTVAGKWEILGGEFVLSVDEFAVGADGMSRPVKVTAMREGELNGGPWFEDHPAGVDWSEGGESTLTWLPPKPRETGEPFPLA
jgi:hypothetical protein